MISPSKVYAYFLKFSQEYKRGVLMNIEEMMCKNIISAEVSSSVNDLARLMKEYNIGFLPIHHRQKIIGVITDRDIVTKMLVNHDEKNLRDYLSPSIITADKKAPISEVLSSMKKNKIKRILITDQNKVVGILSLSDIMKHYKNKQEIIDVLQSIFALEPILREQTTEIDAFYL